MLAAMPAMNAASRPAIATPSRPLGRMSRIRYSNESLYVTPSPDDPPATVSPALTWEISWTRTAAIMPGRIVMNGTNIFGKAPMIGVLRADEIELEAIARWTSTKLVVQYPNDSTNPRPKTMPTTDQKSDVKPVRALPAQEFSC